MVENVIPLRFCKSKVPLVTFRLADGEVHHAIVDTGSEISLLSADLKDRIETREIESSANLVGVNGKSGYKKLLEGKVNPKFVTADEEYELKGLLYDLGSISNHFKDRKENTINISAIIGGDFLKKYNAKIDYEKSVITINS